MPSTSTITRSAAEIAAVPHVARAPVDTTAARILWRRRVAKASRWLHIYGSMVSLAIVLFFSLTGLTLNHQEWFVNQQVTAERHGSMNTSWLSMVDKLQVVEYLRASAGLRGTVADFRIDDAQCEVAFKAPGYEASAVIDRASGHFDVTETRMGFAAVINDLHKGRDTGAAWKVMIDIAAALLVFISLTGLVLLYFVHKYRLAGLMLIGAGALASYLVYMIWVP